MVVGLITLEDVLEQLVGEIEDEFDDDHTELIRDEEGHLVVDGAPLRLLARRLGLALDAPHEATIGGRLVEEAGRVPGAGDGVELDGARLEILAVDEARIVALRASLPAG